MPRPVTTRTFGTHGSGSDESARGHERKLVKVCETRIGRCVGFPLVHDPHQTIDDTRAGIAAHRVDPAITRSRFAAQHLPCADDASVIRALYCPTVPGPRSCDTAPDPPVPAGCDAANSKRARGDPNVGRNRSLQRSEVALCRTHRWNTPLARRGPKSVHGVDDARICLGSRLLRGRLLPALAQGESPVRTNYRPESAE